jgi:hypothetical protein
MAAQQANAGDLLSAEEWQQLVVQAAEAPSRPGTPTLRQGGTTAAWGGGAAGASGGASDAVGGAPADAARTDDSWCDPGRGGGAGRRRRGRRFAVTRAQAGARRTALGARRCAACGPR